MTSKELRDIRFETVRKGYDPDRVDAIMERAADQIDQLNAEKQKADQKMAVLAEKLEEYMAEEDKIRTTLLGAQKMSDTILCEARQKAEILLREAMLKADRATTAAAQRVENEQMAYERLRTEVGRFKNDVLTIYKTHLEVLSTIPEPEQPAAEEESVAEEPAAEQASEPVEPSAEQTAEPAEPSAEEPAEEPVSEAEASDGEPDGQPEEPFEPLAEDTEKTGKEKRSSRFAELDFGDDFSFNRK